MIREAIEAKWGPAGTCCFNVHFSALHATEGFYRPCAKDKMGGGCKGMIMSCWP